MKKKNKIRKELVVIIKHKLKNQYRYGKLMTEKDYSFIGKRYEVLCSHEGKRCERIKFSCDTRVELKMWLSVMYGTWKVKKSRLCKKTYGVSEYAVTLDIS